MVDTKTLRGRIFTDYKSVSEFAKAANISRHVVYNILNHAKLPDSSEISKIGKTLNMTANDMSDIFLSYPSPN